MNYLSDEDLMNLIESVEHEDMIQAPPDLIGNVLDIVDNEKTNSTDNTDDTKFTAISSDKKSISGLSELSHHKTYEERVTEYRRYTFRVVLAMAASLAVCILSQMTDVKQHLQYRQKTVAEYKTRQEVIEENKSIYQRVKEAGLFEISENMED